MPLSQIVAAADDGKAADAATAGSRRLLIDFVSSYPCGLSAVEVEASIYDDERECQESAVHQNPDEK